MRDERKTKKQFLEELQKLRQLSDEVRSREANRTQVDFEGGIVDVMGSSD